MTKDIYSYLVFLLFILFLQQSKAFYGVFLRDSYHVLELVILFHQLICMLPVKINSTNCKNVQLLSWKKKLFCGFLPLFFLCSQFFFHVCSRMIISILSNKLNFTKSSRLTQYVMLIDYKWLFRNFPTLQKRVI